MFDFLRNLLSTDGFVPRRTCGDWSDGHVWLHTTSDLLIWLAYTSIPLVFGYFLWRRRGAVPFPGLVVLFAAFILACGFTHLLDALMFVWPAYRLSGLVKGVTAAVSWLTVATLVPAIPRLLGFLDGLDRRPAAWPGTGTAGQSRPQRYAAAAGLAGLALLARFAADPVLGDGRGFVLPLLAVMAAAWYGGFWPGLLALAMGGGGFAVLFISPRGAVAAGDLSRQMDLGLFVFCGVAAAALGEAQRAARRAAEAATADLHEGNRQLAHSQWAATEALTQLDAFLTHAPVGLAFYDPDLRYVRINNYLADANGLPAEKHLGRTLAEVLPDMPAAVADGFRRVLDTGEPIRDLAVHGTTGPDSVWRVSAYPAHDPHGLTVGLAVVAQDVTERSRQERALAASEERFRTVAEAVPGYVWSATPDGAVDYTSPRVEEYAGAAAGGLTRDGWLGILHPDDVPPTVERWGRSLATGEPYRHEFRLRRADGEYRWHDVQALPTTDAAGAVAKWYGYCADTHERKEAADALAASQERFRQTADAAPAVLWETDPDGTCTFLSRGWYELTGQAAGEGLGLGWLDMTHPDDIGPTGEAFHRANATRATFRMDYRVRRADGGYGWAVDEGRPRFGPAGEYLGMVGSVIDIDARKRAEDEVRASEERYRTLFTTMDQGLCIIEMLDGPAGRPDHDYRFVEANPAFERQTGLAGGVGRTARELAPDLEPHWFARYGGVARTGQAVRFVEHSPAMGRWFDVYASRVGGPGSRRVAVLLTDISDRKRAEEALQRANDELERRVAEATAELRRDKAFLAAVLESVEDGIVACDETGTLTLFNRATKRLHGLPAEPVPADRWADHYSLYGPDGRTPLGRDEVPLFRALAGEEVWDAEMVIAPTGAEPRTLLASGRALFDEDGRRLGAVVSMHDVTDRRRAEAARAELAREQAERRSEERFRTLWATAPVGVSVSRAGHYLFANPAFLGMFGLPPDADLAGRPILDQIAPADHDLVADRVRRRAAGEDVPSEYEVRGVRADGTEFLTDARVAAVELADGPAGVCFMTDITARKRAEEALQRSEADLRQAQRVARVGSWRWAAAADAVAGSDELYRIYGLDPAAGFPPVAAQDGTLYPHDSWRRVSDAVHRAATTGEPFEMDVPALRGGREPIWVTVRSEAERDAAGRVSGLRGTVQDVTARKRAEEALRASQDRLELAVGIAQMGLFEIDLGTDAVEVNEPGRAIYGWDSTRTTFTQVQAHFHPDDKEEVVRRVEAAFDPAGPGVFEVEQRVHRTDGAERWIRVRGQAFFAGDGADRRAVRCVGTYLDVTARKRAEEALRESEANARLALDVARLGTWRWWPADGRVECDARGRDILGWPADGLTLEQIGPTIHPDDLELVEAARRRSLDPAGDGLYAVEHRMVHPDGSVRWVAGRGQTDFAAGAPTLVRGTVADVTERKAAEQALAASEARFRGLADTAPQIIWEADPLGRTTFVSRYREEFSGRSMDSGLGDGWREVIRPDQVARVAANWADAVAGADRYEDLYPVRRADGAYRWFQARGRLVRRPDGAPDRWVGTSTDVHDRVAAEEALAATQRTLTLALATANAGVWAWDAVADRLVVRRPDPASPGVLAALPPLSFAASLAGVHPDDRARVDAAVARCRVGRTLFAEQYRAGDADKGWRWVESRGQFEYAPDGTPTRMVGVVLDIHDRKTAELALADTQRALTLSLAVAKAAAWDWDRAADRVVMRTPDPDRPGELVDAPGRSYADWLATVHPDDRGRVRAAYDHAWDTGGGVAEEYRRADGAGGWRWLEARGQCQPATGSDGQCDRMIGVVIDVHDRKTAEEAARQADIQFRAMADSIPQLAWMTRPDGHIDWYNSRWYEYTGTTAEDMRGWGWERVHDPAELRRMLPKWRAALAAGTPYEDTFPLRRFDGQFRWFLTRARPIRDAAGAITRWFGTNTDVTAQRQLEADLRAAGERFRFLDALGQATREADPRGTLEATCRRLGEHLGATRCAYADMDPDGDHFTIPHDWTDGAASTVGHYSLALFGPRAVADLNAGRPLIVRDVDAELGPAGGADMFNAIGIKAVVCCPLVKGGRLAALMAVHQAEPRDWLPADIGLVTEVVERSWAHVERARAEDAAREAADRFRTLAESVPALVWSSNADGRTDYHSSRWQEYTGRPIDETPGGRWADSVHPDDLPAAVAAWEAALPAVRGYSVEYRLRRHDGAYRWQLAQALPQTDAAGRVVRWYGAVTDIDDQKRLEADLRAAGERFRTLTEAIPQMVWNADADGRVSYVNTRWREYTGLTGAGSAAEWWDLVAHPADAPAVADVWAKALLYQRPEPVKHELRVRRAADGAYRWFSMGVVPLYRPDGGIDQWIGSLSDVHDLKTAEEAIRGSEARFRHLLDAMPNLVWVTDADGRVVQLNRYWATYTGRPLADLAGDGWAALLHPDDAAGAVAAWQACVRHRAPFAAEFRFRVADGGYRWQLARGTPVPGPDGRLSQWFGTTTDIDDRRRAADLLDLQVKERTAELARSNGELEKFAYVASHDLQEPLRKVQAFGDRLATRFAGPLGRDGKEYIDRMQASAARMQTLINDLLAFSRVNSKAKPFAPVPLGPLVDGVVSDLEALTTRTGATVAVGDLPTVHGDPGQLRQLFQNLIANACKFHKPGQPPTVTLAAERLEGLAADADPPAGLPAGWRVTVSDDGIGFEQQYADRIFEVFQRLHGRGHYEGTGIGLAICRKIVERHGGIITARGRPGDGASFAVDLPAPPGDPVQ